MQRWRPERGWLSVFLRITLALAALVLLVTTYRTSLGIERPPTSIQRTRVVEESADRQRELQELIERYAAQQGEVDDERDDPGDEPNTEDRQPGTEPGSGRDEDSDAEEGGEGNG